MPAPHFLQAHRGTHFFYSNEYVDLSLFTHFFARPLVTQGTYVEIGGSNGVHASNTLFFEQQLGWRGILIEPTPCGRCVLPFTRPRDTIINAGACKVPSILNGTYMAGFCPSPQDACVATAPGGYRAYSAPCQPMASLLPRKLTHIDLFSIDVEERVMDVLETIPWQRLAVDVVLAECPGIALTKKCTRFLKAHGFRVLPWLALNGDVLAVREACIA